jgi:hypothetical protein
MPTKSRRFAPRLECLADRSLPATVALFGSTLMITGDELDNTVTIRDTGQLGFVDPESGVRSGGITVVADGVEHWFGTEVRAIVVDTLEGDDTVAYEITGPLASTRLIGVDLGRGADTFTASLDNQAVSGVGTTLGITVDGRGGGDTMSLSAVGTTVEAGASLSVELYGDGGRDAITFSHSFGDPLPANVLLKKDQRR